MTINVPDVLFGYETYYIYHNIGHPTSQSSIFRKLYRMCFNFVCDCKVIIHFSADESGKSSCCTFR